MTDRIIAILSAVNDAGVAQAQLVLRQDGSLDHFGDPGLSVEALALLLRVGPQKLREMTSGSNTKL